MVKRISDEDSAYVRSVLKGTYSNPATSKKKKKEEEESDYVKSVIGGTYKVDFSSINDDIAPTKANAKKEEKKDTWFSKGAFSDGYDIGDITKTILGTTADVVTGVTKGIFGLGEGIGDAINYGAAGVADLFGADKWADDYRKEVSKSITDQIFKPAEDFYDKYSVLGERSDNISQGLGNVAAIIGTGGLGASAGLGAAGTSVLTSGTIGISSMGSGMSEAYQGGATDEEALKYGLISGVAEAGTEMIFGGLGKGVNALGLSKGLSSADDMLAKAVSNKFKTQLAKNLSEYTVKAGAEGLEEVMAGIAQGIGKKVTYMSEEELGKILADEQLLDQFIMGAVTSGVSQAPGLVKTTKAGRDFVTGYTRNEQSVIDKEVQNRIGNKKLTNKEISKITDEVKADFNKGYISTDTIESVLGGDTYAQLQSIRDNKAAIEKEIDKLESKPYVEMTVKENDRLKALREELASIDTNTLETQLQSEMGQKIANDGYLQQSYQEQSKKGQQFTYDTAKITNENEKAVYESAAKVMNDTTRSHEFVEKVAKIAKDRGTSYEFINDEQLKSLGHELEGKKINGLVKDGKILINIDSSKALNTIVGHETTHLLENTQEYTDLQEAIFNYAKEKGDYNERLESLTSLYQNVEGANVDTELTADLVGDYLFTDEAFINQLSTEKPTVFQKIKQLIDDLVVKFTGTKEEKALREVQKKFKEAYKNVASKGTSTQYSLISDNANKTYIQEANKNKAIMMQKKGATEQEIWLATGYQYNNGQWQTEVKDPKIKSNQILEQGKEYRLEDVLDAEELFKAYPELKNRTVTKVDFNQLAETERERAVAKGLKGATTNDGNIYLSSTIKTRIGAEEVLTHEVQHLIQELEGIEGNDNSYLLQDNDGKYYVSKEYLLDLGEIEARQVQNRANMSESERQSILPKNTSSKVDMTRYSLNADTDLSYQKGKYDKAWGRGITVNDMYKQLDKLADNSRNDVDNAETFEQIEKAKDNPEAKIKIYRATTSDSINTGDWVFLNRNHADRLTRSLFGNKPIPGYKVVEEIVKAKDVDWTGKNLEFVYSPNGERSIKYSLTDNQGRTLTKEQQEYFKDSKVRDENGNLLTVYHGTNNDFTIFDKEFIGRNTNNEGIFGKGFYFTEKKSLADNYNRKDGKVAKDGSGTTMELYLDMKNPFYWNSIDTKEKMETFIEEMGMPKYVVRWNNTLKNQMAPITDIKAERKFSEVLQKNGYDGVVYKYEDGVSEYVVFNSNQIKNIDNTNPTSDADIRYSLSEGNIKDVSTGYSSDEYYYEMQYTQDGKVVGTLKYGDYKGEPNVKMIEVDPEYQRKGIGTKLLQELQNKYKGVEIDFGMSTPDGTALLEKATYQVENTEIVEKQNRINEISKILDEYDKTYNDYYENNVPIPKNYAEDYNDLYDERYRLQEEIRGKSATKTFVKGVDEYSLSKFNEQRAAAKGNYNVYSEDVKLAIAPLQEEIQTLTETVQELKEQIAPVQESPVESKKSPVTVGQEVEYTQPTKAELDNIMALQEKGGTEYANAFFELRDKYGQRKLYKAIREYKKAPDTYEAPIKGDEYAPTPQNIVEQQGQEAFNNIDESSMPIETEDIAPDIDYKMTSSKSLFETRDYEDVGNRKVNAYQYDNPEVKPFFQEEAQAMLGDLKGSIKGERQYNDELYYSSGGEQGFYGVERQTTSDIAELLDGMDGKFKYSYADIEKGLNAIINDEGSENNAISKRIEFYLDQRLREGYTTVDGFEVPANQEYINMMAVKEMNDYYNSLPITDDMAPVKYAENVSNSKDIAPIKSKPEKNDLGYIPQDPTRESTYESNKRDPLMEYVDRQVGKQIESKVKQQPKVTKQKSSTKNTLNYLFVNRNEAVDRFAKATGNNNIKFLADHVNNIQGEISTNINKAQIDNYGKAIGKSLTDIFNQPRKAGLSEAFDDYLFHKSNIERHKNSKGSIVPVSGSQKFIREYEKSYPEFKEWANEVNQYNRNNLQKQVDAGLYTQELADTITKMYDFYVPFFEDVERLYIPDETGEIKRSGTIKRATGGAKRKLLGFEEAMMQQTQSTITAIRKNQLYKEIVDSSHEKVQLDDDSTNGLYVDDSGYYLTAKIDGENVTANISEDLYKGLENKGERYIKDIEQKLSKVTKPLQALTTFRKKTLTSWSPTFLAKNFIKDVQDAPLNSKHAKDWVLMYPKAFEELSTGKGKHVQEFLNLYGQAGILGDYIIDSGISDIKDIKTQKKLLGFARINEVVELAPRYAEYLASLKNGASQMEALYDAREVTTNFGRGGIITQAFNRNGFAFLNPSVQGFNKMYRNFSGENGAKGVVNATFKAVMLGVAPALFNALAFGAGDDEDEDYKALPDYIKDNYYLFKTDDGEFIRIPKGRMISVFGSAARRTLEFTQGEKDAYKGFMQNAYSQIGIQNPLESNIFAPLMQAYGSENGTAWYGGDIVPSRLQDVPKAEQYDETTDAFSIWLGEKTGISPYKFNYVLDQYTGGIGDLLLPTITEEATSDGSLLAPIKDQFTANSTSDNKYVSDVYTLSDELNIKSNSIHATEEDALRKQYIYSITREMAELYAERREVQNDDSLTKAEKYEKAQAIKDQINSLAKEGLDNYQDMDKRENYAIVGGREFNKYTTNDGEERWGSVDEETLEEMNALGMDLDEKNTYYTAKGEISGIYDKYDKLLDGTSDEDKTNDLYAQRKLDIASVVKNTNLTNDQKYYMYDKYYGNTETINTMKMLDIDADSYIDYNSQTFYADKDSEGKTISGSKKEKVFDYINGMNIGFEQKVILAKLAYPSYDEWNYEIIEYLNNNDDISYEEEVFILKELGFEVDDEGNITWD